MSDDSNLDLINWKTITEDNPEDPIRDIVEKAGQSSGMRKSGRGRPRKIVPAEPLLPAEPGPLAPPLTPEESMSTMQLMDTLRKSKSQSPPRRKSALRFSQEEPAAVPPAENTDPDPERMTLLRMYKQYFKKPLLDRHTRKEVRWTDKHATSEIHREIKELDAAVSEEDPASMLASVWVQLMTGVETFGPPFGLAANNLGYVADAASHSEGFKSNMRELLIKYPYLRKLLGLGGYPELKLLIITGTIIRQVHDENMKNPRGVDPAHIPDDVKSAFQTL